MDFLEAIERASAHVATVALMAWRRFFPREEDVEEIRERLEPDGNLIDRTIIRRRELIGDYRAARDFLERRFRDRWSPRAEVTGKDGAPLLDGTGLVIEVVQAAPEEPEDEAGRRAQPSGRRGVDGVR